MLQDSRGANSAHATYPSFDVNIPVGMVDSKVLLSASENDESNSIKEAVKPFGKSRLEAVKAWLKSEYNIARLKVSNVTLLACHNFSSEIFSVSDSRFQPPKPSLLDMGSREESFRTYMMGTTSSVFDLVKAKASGDVVRLIKKDAGIQYLPSTIADDRNLDVPVFDEKGTSQRAVFSLDPSQVGELLVDTHADIQSLKDRLGRAKLYRLGVEKGTVDAGNFDGAHSFRKFVNQHINKLNIVINSSYDVRFKEEELPNPMGKLKAQYRRAAKALDKERAVVTPIVSFRVKKRDEAINKRERALLKKAETSKLLTYPNSAIQAVYDAALAIKLGFSLKAIKGFAQAQLDAGASERIALAEKQTDISKDAARQRRDNATQGAQTIEYMLRGHLAEFNHAADVMNQRADALEMADRQIEFLEGQIETQQRHYDQAALYCLLKGQNPLKVRLDTQKQRRRSEGIAFIARQDKALEAVDGAPMALGLKAA